MGKDAGGYFNVSYRFSSRIFGMFSSLKTLRINLFCIIIHCNVSIERFGNHHV